MRRWWLKLQLRQKRIIAVFLVLLSMELLICVSIGLGRGLQQVFLYQCRVWAKQVHKVDRMPYAALINESGERYNLDPALIAAVIRCESNFEPRAFSRAGAVGLMQICLPTWGDLKVGETNWQIYQSPDDDLRALYHPDINIPAGTKYLKMMLLRYRGDVIKSIAAYNAGPGSIDQYKGIPPYAETRRYVNQVLLAWIDYRGVQNLAVTWYRWGSNMENLAIMAQGKLLIIFFSVVIVSVVTGLMHRYKRRW